MNTMKASICIFVELIFLSLSFEHSENEETIKTIKSDYNLVKQLFKPTLEANVNGNNYHAVSHTNNATHSAMTPSFAILINFGIDGRVRKLFSSNSNNLECNDKQIWDPFNNECRPLYCSAQFTLVHFECIETNNATTNISKPIVSYMDTQSESVNITLRFTINNSVSDPLKWINSHNKSFSDEFTKQFTDSFMKISSQRITNVIYVRSSGLNQFEVNFALLEGNKSETLNNDAFVNVLSTTISENGLTFNLYEKSVKAYSIHTILSELKDFCIRDTDMPLWYWNSEFNFMKNENITYLYVNETGRKYYPGQYIAQTLYVHNLDILANETPNIVNVSSNAIVCETQTLINDSCRRILLTHDEYEWINDGRQLRTKSGQIHDRYELGPNGTVFICFIPKKCFSKTSDLNRLKRNRMNSQTLRFE